MGMLERLSDARGTLEGKIVAVILAILLVLPVATVTAFAGDHDEDDATTQTEQAEQSTPVEKQVVEETKDKGSVPIVEAEPEPETTDPVQAPEETAAVPVQKPSEDAPAVVKDFIAAVDRLQNFGEVTEANAEQFNALGQEAMDAYEAVQDAGYEDYEGVPEALDALMAIMDSFTGGAMFADASNPLSGLPKTDHNTAQQVYFYAQIPSEFLSSNISNVNDPNNYWLAMGKGWIWDQYDLRDAWLNQYDDSNYGFVLSEPMSSLVLSYPESYPDITLTDKFGKTRKFCYGSDLKNGYDGSYTVDWDYVRISRGFNAGNDGTTKFDTNSQDAWRFTYHCDGKLSFNYRTHKVSYEWSGLGDDVVSLRNFDDTSQNISTELPDGVTGIKEGDPHTVDATHPAGQKAYAYDDKGDVIAIYQFSGWMLNGEGEPVTGDITVNTDIVLKGVWTRLDKACVGTVDIKNWMYDGKYADDKSHGLTSELKSATTNEPISEDADYTYFKQKEKEDGNSDAISDWEEYEGVPKDAGTYKVVATWAQNDQHLAVTAEKEFVISKREVEITGASGTWSFDGITHSTKNLNGAYNAVHDGVKAVASTAGDGFVEDEGVDVGYSAEILSGGPIENPFDTEYWDGTNPNNYNFKTTPGKLEITVRDDASKTLITLTANNFGQIMYDGDQHDFSGVASITSNDSDVTNGVVNNNDGTATFTYRGNDYTVSNFTTTGPKNAKDANLKLDDGSDEYGTYPNNIVVKAPEGTDAANAKIKVTLGGANGVDVTEQFNVQTEDRSAQIVPRTPSLYAKDVTKVYDGNPVVLADEQMVVTDKTGQPFDVSHDPVLAKEADVKSSLNEAEYVNVKRGANNEVVSYAGANVLNAGCIAPKTDAEGNVLFKASNYEIDYHSGNVTILPQSIDPGDSTETIPDPDPNEPDRPFVPSDPDNPYRGAKVGSLANEQYNGIAWEQEKRPDVFATLHGVQVKLKNDDYTVADATANNDTTNVGTKTVTVTGKGNYTGTVTRTYEVTKAPVVIVVNSSSKTYGEKDPTNNFSGTAGIVSKSESGEWSKGENGQYNLGQLFTNDRNLDENGSPKRDEPGVITYYRTNADVEDAGEYQGVLDVVRNERNANGDIAGIAFNPNYSVVDVVPGNFTISQAPASVSLSVSSIEETYDGNSYAVSVNQLGDGWKIEYASTANGPWSEVNPTYKNAGVYPVFVKATHNNFTGLTGTGTVAINPRPITITVNDATKVAGTADPAFDGSITNGSLVEGEDLGLTYSRSNSDEAVGAYENVLTAAYENADVAKNYTIEVVNGDFTITPMAAPVPPTPPTPGPLDALVTTVTDFLATPIIGPGAMAAIGDGETPLAQIDDEGNPLSAFDHPVCWVHYYILLGIIITAIYGGGVIARRLGYNHKVKKYEDDVLDEDKSKGTAKNPVANEGVQPVI